jgi:hypothetical protein
MAENTEKYKIVIDTQVEGSENIDLLSRTVKTSIGEFDNLNEAISKTQDTLGKLDPKKDAAKFKELSKELAGLKDNLADVEIQSSRFTEALAKQPGAIGFVGQSLEGLRGTFKVFMANPIIAVLTAIAGAFLTLRESLQRTEEGQEKLNKISESFTKILNGLFAIVEPLANLIVDFVIGLLENEKVMSALSVTAGILSATFTTLFNITSGLVDIIVNNLIIGFRTLIDVGSAAGKVLKGVFTLDLGLIKEGLNGVKDAYVDGVKDVVKNVVDGAKQIANGVVDGITSGFNSGVAAFKEGSKRLSKAEREEAEKRRKEAEERAKREAEEQARLIEEANKIILQAYISTLEERDAEIFKRDLRYNEERAKLIAAGVEDLTLLEEQYRKDILSINEKYDDIQRRKELEEEERIRAIREAEFNDTLLGLELEFEEIGQSFDRQRDLIREKEALLLQQEELTENQRTAIRRAAAEERMAIDMAELEGRADVQDAYLGLVGDFGNLLQQIAGENKKLAITGIIIEQASNIGRIISNTALANAKAVAALPLTGGLPFTAINTASAALGIASSIAGAAKAISQINSAGSGGSVGSLSSLSSSIQRPQIASGTAPQITGAENGINPSQQIAETLSRRDERPTRAYVVSTEISSQAALDRRTNRAATFSG